MEVPSSSMGPNGNENLPKVTFGVKRKVETRLVTSELVHVASDSEEERERVEAEKRAKKKKITHFDGGIVPDDEEKLKTMVIPIVVENDWRIAKLLEKQKEGELTDEENAKLALLMQSTTSQETSEGSSNEVILNQDSKEDPPDADYSAVPIESFGLAILRGCNWKDGEGIGKNPQVVKLRLPARRPHGLGLGATPKVVQQKGQSKEEGGAGEISKGSCIKIVDGRSKGLYGKVEARDDDSNSLFVRLALGGKSVKVSVYAAQAVTAKEYEKDAKCINKDSYDREKKNIARKIEIAQGERRGHDEKHRNSDDKYDKSHSKRLWVRTDLVVRFIEKSFEKGRLYGEKLRVVDVASRKDVTLEDNKGKTYYNVPQSFIETVIPRNDGETVMILSGSKKGLVAILVEKDKRKEKVVVRVCSSNEIVTLYFDDVCQYRSKDDYEFE